MEATNDLFTWLNQWVKEQPFLTALLTTAFSGFAIVLIKYFRKKESSISYAQKRGWPDDITRSDLIERLLAEVNTRRASGLHKDVAITLKMQLQFSQVRPSFKLATTGTKPDPELHYSGVHSRMRQNKSSQSTIS